MEVRIAGPNSLSLPHSLITQESDTASTTAPSRRTGPRASSVARAVEVRSYSLCLTFVTCSPFAPSIAGHMARDCTQRRGPPGAPGFGGPPGPGGVAPDPARAQQFDSEYASLMAELGETSSSAPMAAGAIEGAPGQGQPVGAPWNAGPGGNMPGPPLDENGEKIAPWRIPSNWYVLTILGAWPRAHRRLRRNPPQPAQNFNRGPPQPQPQHAAYTGQSQGYSSFPSMQGQCTLLSRRPQRRDAHAPFSLDGGGGYQQQQQAPGYPGAQSQAPYAGGYQQQAPYGQQQPQQQY